MTHDKNFEVIIIGGSYSGLSAALTLGRSLRNVLVIDSGLPCNRQTPQSHNFITQDGEKPNVIAEKAKTQILKYQTVKFKNDLVTNGKKTASGFEISTESGVNYTTKKLIFATGIKDLMPNLYGFSDCWGISVIHCPYCHGYEVKNEKTAILANGNIAYHYAQMIRNLTKDLIIFTNGKKDFTTKQMARLTANNIQIIEKEIASINHENGFVKELIFNDQSSHELKVIYARPNFEQSCKVAEILDCELTETGHIKIDASQKTTVNGIFACGDNSSVMRSVANAVASGNMAAAMVNNSLTQEEF